MTRRWHSLHWLATASTAVLGACGDNQSALNPKGPDALQIAHLSWLLFAVGTAVLILVLIAVAAAILGPDVARRWLASARTVVWAGVVFPVVVLTVLLAYGVWLTRASTALPQDPNAVRIEVVGEQWWWRVAYLRPDGDPIVSANEIRIPAGRPVSFTLKSADVIHSFWVPNLGGKLDMIPGRTTHLRLRAEEPGVFRGQCAEYCGGPHALMSLEVVALAPAEFDAWLEGQAGPAVDASSSAFRRGRELFNAAGCGACHTVRGTEAKGTLGPDLTHLGSRRSVGVVGIATTEANIARFIRDGQHIKPGNLMPPFRILTDSELAALATYLAGLR